MDPDEMPKEHSVSSSESSDDSPSAS